VRMNVEAKGESHFCVACGRNRQSESFKTRIKIQKMASSQDMTEINGSNNAFPTSLTLEFLTLCLESNRVTFKVGFAYRVSI
jgi:hypothetical protein